MDDHEDWIDDEGMVTNYVKSDTMYCLVDHPTDPSAATWALQAARLNTPRCHHASIAFEGKIWVAGRWDGGESYLSSVEVYDPAVGEWERAPDMTKGRVGLTLVAVGDELYAVGVDLHYPKYNLSIEKLSKVSGAWEIITTLEEVGRSSCSVAVVGSKIYVLGGRCEGLTFTWNAFDVITKQWASASISDESCVLPRDEFSGGQAISVPSCLDNGKRMTWNG